MVDLVVCTGGLGPTEDDVTRDAVARVLGVPLDVDEAIVEQIRSAVRAPRHGDAGDQPAAGDGAARRQLVLENAERHGAGPAGSSTAGRAIVLLPGRRAR